ncbi:MAG: hypothetical protein KAS32_09950 [Candidatus Peribacteraceae bacterium]|nr:hypothetical protein [Candidatus Peribacteraceae bacterium]
MAIFRTDQAAVGVPVIDNFSKSGAATAIPIKYNSGSQSIDPSVDTLYLCPVPNHSWILSAKENHSSGETTCTFSLGVDSALTAFSASVAKGVAASQLAFPYHVDLSDNASPQYIYVALGPNAGTASTSVTVDAVVTYVKDADNS